MGFFGFFYFVCFFVLFFYLELIAGLVGQPIFPSVLSGTVRLWCLELSCDVFSLLVTCWVQKLDLKRELTDCLCALEPNVIGIDPG